MTSNNGTITFDATHGQSPPASSDGTFNAGSQVDPSNGSGGNSITFSAAHNLSTGSVITYSPNGSPTIGGLTPSRAYNVIVTSSTQVQLGDSLDGVVGRHDLRRPRLRQPEPQLPGRRLRLLLRGRQPRSAA